MCSSMMLLTSTSPVRIQLNSNVQNLLMDSRNNSQKALGGYTVCAHIHLCFKLLDMASLKTTPDECTDGDQPYSRAKNCYENMLLCMDT